jgi:hypothetical protein
MSVLVFIGIVLLILSVPFLFVARANAKLLHRLNTVETYDAATLDEIHRRITLFDLVKSPVLLSATLL